MSLGKEIAAEVGKSLREVIANGVASTRVAANVRNRLAALDDATLMRELMDTAALIARSDLEYSVTIMRGECIDATTEDREIARRNVQSFAEELRQLVAQWSDESLLAIRSPIVSEELDKARKLWA